MRISALKRQKRRQDRVNVYVDGEFRMAVAAEVALRAGLKRGAAFDAATAAELEAADAAWRAREAALNLLSFRQRSERELRQRLGRKGFEEAAIEDAVQKLSTAGLIDDTAFALAFARDRLRTRPSGPLKLGAELRAKGIDADTAAELLDELYSELESELDVARRAARKFAPKKGEDALKTRRRLYGFLARRGFTGDTIREVLEDAADDPVD